MAQLKKPATTKSLGVPIVWKTTKATADRLLGHEGRPLLDKAINLAKDVAAKRKWPLKQIKVQRYQDLEYPDWENLEVVLVFDCPGPRARKLWLRYLREVDQLQHSMDHETVERFIDIYLGYELA